MMFMNRWEIEDAVLQYAVETEDPILGPASLTLRNLMHWADANSDGWAYWPKPCRAAARLQALITEAHPLRHDRTKPTVESYKTALRPIKAFRTKQNADFDIVEV